MKYHYDKFPFIEVDGNAYDGYDRILAHLNERVEKLNKNRVVMVIDFYPGVKTEEVYEFLVKPMKAALEIFSDDEIFIPDDELNSLIQPYLTDDRVFGIMCPNKLSNYLDERKLSATVSRIDAASGLVVIYGVGASLAYEPDLYIYADLARWEIQKRYRGGEISNWKSDNFNDDALVKYKRGFFFEWRIADRHKKENYGRFDYVLDTNTINSAKMLAAETFFHALEEVLHRPFRVVPYFDQGVWGGQWMKEKCDLDKNSENYAWCFDCVPEENSILIKVGETLIEIPSINIVFLHPVELLGEKIFARYGDEFPIRFDFLDTMEGGNLSLQVHPLTEYIRENFGMPYTQDESYYLLDAREDAKVYLGFLSGVDKEAFEGDLIDAETGDFKFPAEKYVNLFDCKKHDHFLIPAGTVHCTGANTMVLEISSTPFIFTFKLWDWGRVGLDGRPRPVHLGHGFKNLQYYRDTEWTKENLINRFEKVDEGDGWIEERTGLHEREPIETRRHVFSKTVEHDTNGIVNVLNLVEGGQAVIESPDSSFAPFIVNYAETFIIPASVGRYTITPCGVSEGETIITLKAYIRC